jgi:Ca2+-binding RTX toxin-like protein
MTMAVTTSYTWIYGASSFLNDVFTAGDQVDPAVASNAAGDRYFVAWSDPSNSDQVNGRIVNADDIPLTGEFTVNNTANAATTQYDPSVAGLTGGNFVVTYTDLAADPDGDIRARLYTSGGNPVGSDFAIDNGAFADTQSSVSELSGGGFVVTYTRNIGLGNTDIRARVFDQNGNGLSGLITVDPSAGGQTASSVAGLSSGGFVAVWQDNASDEVYFRRFQSDGIALDPGRVLIDTIGTINQDIHVVALADGGYAVAYTDSGWSIDDTDITFRIFNADGTTRTSFIHANREAFGGIETGDQDLPTITTMGELIVVGWRDADSATVRAQVFDAQGNALGDNALLSDHVLDPEFAGLANGHLANVRRSSISEGAGLGDSIRSVVSQLVCSRTGESAVNDVITGLYGDLQERLIGFGGDDVLIGGAGGDELLGGNGSDTASYETAPAGLTASLADSSINTGHAAGDTYALIENLTGSGLGDTLIGNSGANTLIGGAGNDRLLGGGGQDMIDGGAGSDTAGLSLNFNDYIVHDFGAEIVVGGLDGIRTLRSIEHLEFANTTITLADVANDGNPLFDTLYYLSRNDDVFQAGVNALDHYNASGWHEGRDPNAFFDTSFYLAVNKDVAAAGVNPLAHYHLGGWQQGRDPSANFDTALYLINNPDVAAAGIDPLAHYLANGRAEGRSTYAAVGAVSNGFDAQYYLFHNPDVAAAGVDALTHYNAVGWQEGRDPNAWFDTSGYLAHNIDVAAAGINPLQHYQAVGWQEGRDASAGFDTLGYLAANPDVAAAGLNPLDHFLQFGIYEGRQPVNDGMWN